MANPSAIYQVSYGGTQLPGYVQSVDRPLSIRSADSAVLGRDGINSHVTGAEARQISLNFLIMSSLEDGTGLQHLDNVTDQQRQSMAILTREPGYKPLVIHDSDRYWIAKVDSITSPQQAGIYRNMKFSVNFTAANPFAYAAVETTDTFTGNDTLSLALGDSRRAYPRFTIPSGVTAFTATDENSKVLQFLRGTATGEITIDCGSMTAINASGVNVITTLVELDFGLHYKGTDGTYGITITGFAGSGTVTAGIRARYEL